MADASRALRYSSAGDRRIAHGNDCLCREPGGAEEADLLPGAPTPPAELAKFVAKEVDAWGQVVQKAGIAGIE